MYLLIWVGAAWLAAAAVVTMAFFGARRSPLLYAWLFGDKPTAEVRRLVQPTRAIEQAIRLAA